MIRPRCIAPADLARSLAILRGQPVPEPTPPAAPAGPQTPDHDSRSERHQSGTHVVAGLGSQSSVAQETPPDWTAFHDEVRHLERDLSLQLFTAAQERIRAIRLGSAAKHSLSNVTRLLDLASRLARRALGKTDELEMGACNSDILAEFEQAIKQMSAQPPVAEPGKPASAAAAPTAAPKP